MKRRARRSKRVAASEVEAVRADVPSSICGVKGTPTAAELAAIENEIRADAVTVEVVRVREVRARIVGTRAEADYGPA